MEVFTALSLRPRVKLYEIAGWQQAFDLSGSVSSENLGRWARIVITEVNPDGLARALEIDPAYLMQLALEQAVGKTASVALLEVFGPLIPANEKAWLEEIRDASGQTDPKLTARSRTALRSIFGR